MKYLIDTHTFLWFVDGSEDLPQSIRGWIEDPENDIHCSIASYREIGIKASIGKLPLKTSLLGLEAIAADQSILNLPLTVQAIQTAQYLPYHHKDPFDRIIAATALTTGDLLLSADSIFDAYEVPRQWQQR